MAFDTFISRNLVTIYQLMDEIYSDPNPLSRTNFVHGAVHEQFGVAKQRLFTSPEKFLSKAKAKPQEAGEDKVDAAPTSNSVTPVMALLVLNLLSLGIALAKEQVYFWLVLPLGLTRRIRPETAREKEGYQDMGHEVNSAILQFQISGRASRL